LERKATQHHDFVGEVAAQEKIKAVIDAQEEKKHVVNEMAAELEELSKKDGAIGPEIPLRIPRSVEEGKRLIREAPDVLREKARERLSHLPEPAQRAIQAAQEAAGLLFAPMRVGMHIARELLRVPLALVRALRHKEA
jgi:hypothetical protein